MSLFHTSTTASRAYVAAHVQLCVGPSYQALKIRLRHLFQLLVIITRLAYAPLRDGHGLAKDKAQVKFDKTVRPTMSWQKYCMKHKCSISRICIIDVYIAI